MSFASRIYSSSPVFLQNLLCSIEGWRVRRAQIGGGFKDFLSFSEAFDLMPESERLSYQLDRLSTLCHHAVNHVPYYKSFNAYSQSIKDLEDFSNFPVLEKEVVRARASEFISDDLNKRLTKQFKTSGTTGAGLAMYHDVEAFRAQVALWWRFRKRFGVDLNSRWANFSGAEVVSRSESRPPFWRYNYAANQAYFSVYHISESTIPAYLKELANGRYEWISGYPSALIQIAKYIKEKNISFSHSLKVITTGSETLNEYDRLIIASAFEVPVVQMYGLVEMSASMSMCEHGNYHSDDVGCYLELLDRGDGYHDIIGTGLLDFAMPFIRYRTGDLAEKYEGKCGCGRGGIVVKSIVGRVEDCIRLSDGRRIGRLAKVFTDLNSLRECQIVQTAIDKITVNFVPIAGVQFVEKEKFHQRLISMVGGGVEIKYEKCDSIPRGPNGKFRAVISMV
ncbi:MAG TPA: hypothetical protein PKX08_10225 [Cyclobacteriaceae bacterium]|nr:hypothetical protein [Cyclobacteriaceae bacterium]